MIKIKQKLKEMNGVSNHDNNFIFAKRKKEKKGKPFVNAEVEEEKIKRRGERENFLFFIFFFSLVSSVSFYLSPI